MDLWSIAPELCLLRISLLEKMSDVQFFPSPMELRVAYSVVVLKPCNFELSCRLEDS